MDNIDIGDASLLREHWTKGSYGCMDPVSGGEGKEKSYEWKNTDSEWREASSRLLFTLSPNKEASEEVSEEGFCEVVR